MGKIEQDGESREMCTNMISDSLERLDADLELKKHTTSEYYANAEDDSGGMVAEMKQFGNIAILVMIIETDRCSFKGENFLDMVDADIEEIN